MKLNSMQGYALISMSWTMEIILNPNDRKIKASTESGVCTICMDTIA